MEIRAKRKHKREQKENIGKEKREKKVTERRTGGIS